MSAVLETYDSGLLSHCQNNVVYIPPYFNMTDSKNSQEFSMVHSTKIFPFQSSLKRMLKQGLKTLTVQIPGYPHHKATYKYMYA